MAEFSVRTNSGIVAAALERGGRRANVAVHKVTIDYGYRSLALIRRNASGRPGPNAPTGDYRRSFGITFHLDGSVSVGTNAVQGRRLEHGFFGTDSLGRKVRQRPYPHVGPAMRQIRVPYQVAVMKAARDAVQGRAA